MQNICKYKIKLNMEMRDILKNLRKIMLVMCILLIIGTIFTIVSDQNKLENTSYAKATNSSDIQLMARAINGEARGEPYAGQVAVAAVVLNRVKSSSFPNTIAGVIYQKGAFTAVSDGQINLTPNQTAYNAARDALNGCDPSYGSIYYFNPSTATNAWIWSRPHVVTIGKHRFCK